MRIVVCGPAAAGKTTILQAIAGAHLAPSAIELVESERLNGASRILLVLDGQRSRAGENRAWIERVAQDPTLRVGCVIVTKLDLPDAAFETSHLLRGTRLEDWPVAATRKGNVAEALVAMDALVATR